MITTKTRAALAALLLVCLSLPQATLSDESYRSNAVQAGNLTALAEATIGPDLMLAQKAENAQTDQQDASKPLGEKPPLLDLSRLFLREATVLLEPGEVEFELALRYLRHEVEQSGFEFRDRELRVTPTVRGGLLPRMEGFVEVPVVWRQSRFLVAAGSPPSIFEFEDDKAGVGDISAGLKYVLVREQNIWPDLVGAVNFTGPSGDAPDPNDVTTVGLGTGRWRVGGALTAIRSYDPAVVFGGVGYEYSLDETLSGVEVSGGSRFTYNFGIGFSVNDQLTLSGIILGEVRDELEFDGVTSLGTDFEPISLRATTTYRAAREHVFEPSVQFGLNEDAPDVELRLSYIFYL